MYIIGYLRELTLDGKYLLAPLQILEKFKNVLDLKDKPNLSVEEQTV